MRCEMKAGIGRLKAALFMIVGIVLLAGEARGRWFVYEDCRLVPNDYNDGDSFHVRHKKRRYIFRLYFVDAPETDPEFSERIAEQADYWNIDDKAGLKIGKEAAAFTRDFLKDGFTVYTERTDARGRSRKPRYFAMIKVGDEYLSEALVDAGLARIYGKMTDLEDGTRMKKYSATLRSAERDAKKHRRGAWDLDRLPRAERPVFEIPVIEEQDVVLEESIPVYSLKSKRMVGVLRRGSKVRVIKAESYYKVRIRFKAKGKVYEAQCQRADLGL